MTCPKLNRLGRLPPPRRQDESVIVGFVVVQRHIRHASTWICAQIQFDRDYKGRNEKVSDQSSKLAPNRTPANWICPGIAHCAPGTLFPTH